MTATIRFRGRSFELRHGESVLECLERGGESLPASCRAGVCQSCLLRATSGEVPQEAQKGLRPLLKKRSCLLACTCKPHGDLQLVTVEDSETRKSRVLQVRPVSGHVYRVLLERPVSFEYEAGQFVHVIRPADGLTRPYSLASLPADPYLEMHIAVRQEGRMSRWLTESKDQLVMLKGPCGDCTFQAQSPQTPLLLIASGTGLAPLFGVLRSALAKHHRGPILLCHGSHRLDGLYLWRQLLELAKHHPELELQGWVQEPPGDSARGVLVGRLGPGLLETRPDLAQSEIYLCGNPELVLALKKSAYLHGACLTRIHADPFVKASSQGST